MAMPVKLNLFVDKACNRIVYAESDEHFLDILLSFLTHPLGSILRLTKQSFGSMNNLLESVESLDNVCFNSEACRSMLLCPSNSASHLLSSLPINYDNMIKFMISDDLFVSKFSVESAIEQLSKLDIKQRSCLESVNVNITPEKIVELLKRLLVSDTPLTDVFLGIHEEKDNLPVDIQPPLRPKCDETETPTESARKITLKLHVKEDEETAFFAEADNDFADLLFGFLTYPMGAVIKKLGGHSGIRCMDNLYNSVEALKTANCFNNNGLIGKLLDQKLPPFFDAENQLIKLDEETQTRRQLNPAIPRRGFKDDPSTGGGYLRISEYVVTDNLVIRQPSSDMILTGILRKDDAGKGIDSLKGGIHVKNVEIGEHEALALLHASITSENVLTDALLGVE
ncbi:hypothetical protein KSP39_PZI004856 [Platanthera zijinensis]|uniref:DUF674 family protein n=1 Tax=Platanthera zijinensis TaxID=2320716 RepID=A0AAP0BYG0_9ASPA